MPIINVNDIIVRKRLRKVDQEKARQMSESIKDMGLITPILLNGKTLIAGAHRLEAHKILNISQIAYTSIGDTNDQEMLSVYEIDENLFRNELSPAERAEHISKRVEIMAKRKLPEKVKEQEEKAIKNRSAVESDKVCQNIQQRAESKSKAEAKKELASSLGMDTTHINAEIKNHEAVTNAGLDQNKLEELNGAQYKRVASVAKKEGAQAAQVELDVQLAKKKTDKPNGTLKESVISHDWHAKVKKDISRLMDAMAIIRRLQSDPKLNAGDFEDCYFADADLNPLIDFLKGKVDGRNAGR